jgi:hypothetical protein
VKDPLFHKRFFPGGLQNTYQQISAQGYVDTDFGNRLRNKFWIELQHGKLRRVEDFVAEFAVPFHAQDFEVYVAT